MSIIRHAALAAIMLVLSVASADAQTVPNPTANTIYRDYVTDGVPTSGAYAPKKAEIRAWGTTVETGLAGVGAISNNVSDPKYGAACNGTTDDTAAFVAMIADTPVGGTMIVSKGVCRVSGFTLNKADQRLVVMPQATIKGVASISANLISITASGVSIVGGGKLDGNRSGAVGTPSCVSVGVVNDTKIDDLTIQHCAQYGIVTSNGHRGRLSNLYLTDTGQTSIFLNNDGVTSSKDWRVTDILVDRSAEGIGVVGLGVLQNSNVLPCVAYYDKATFSNINVRLPDNTTATTIGFATRCVLGSAFSNINTWGGTFGVSLDNAFSSTWTGGSVTRAKTFAFEIPESSHVTVTGVAIDGENLTTNGVVIDGNTPSTFITISGADVRRTTGQLLFADGGNNIVVAKSIFLASTGSSIMNFKNTRNVVVSGNLLDGASIGNRGISFEINTDLSLGRNAAISGNTFKNFVIALLSTFSSIGGATLKELSFSGNTIGGGVANLLTNDGGVTLGANIRTSGNTHLEANGAIVEYSDFASNVLTGTLNATPEGVVNAGVGSTISRTNGGAGTTFYVKESGTGFTGWVAK